MQIGLDRLDLVFVLIKAVWQILKLRIPLNVSNSLCACDNAAAGGRFRKWAEREEALDRLARAPVLLRFVLQLLEQRVYLLLDGDPARFRLLGVVGHVFKFVDKFLDKRCVGLRFADPSAPNHIEPVEIAIIRRWPDQSTRQGLLLPDDTCRAAGPESVYSR